MVGEFIDLLIFFQTSEREMYLKERGEDKADPEILAKMSSEVLYKIDVPANRFFQFLFSRVSTQI